MKGKHLNFRYIPPKDGEEHPLQAEGNFLIQGGTEESGGVPETNVMPIIKYTIKV